MKSFYLSAILAFLLTNGKLLAQTQTPPTLSCSPNITETACLSANGTVVNYPFPSVINPDNYPIVGVTQIQGPPSGAFFPVGTTTVEFELTYNCGIFWLGTCTTTCGFTVTVNPPPNIYFRDFDGDGFGNPNNTILACSQPVGYVTNSSDCDDTKLLYADLDGDGYGAGSPVACGVADNTDCNDADNSVHAPVTYYKDNDNDGFGDPNNSTTVCQSTPPAGYVTNSSDCDDTRLLYADNDGDGYGAGSPVACGVADNTDCNDADNSVHAPVTYYKDNDNDGFGDPNNSTTVCQSTPPAGYVSNSTDCDDTRASV